MLPNRLLASAALLLAPFVTVCEANPPALSATPLISEESKTLLQLLEHVHYLNTPVTDETFQRLITGFMTDLDEQRMFFLAPDEASFLQTYGPMLGTKLRERGDLSAAFAIFSLYRDRAVARTEWVVKELEQPIDLTTDETFPVKRDDAPWPATMAEADALWRARIKLELIPDLLNGKSMDDARATVTKRYERMRKNLEELEASDVEEIFLSSLTRLYDPHSTFFSAETYEDFSISMRLSLVGIGALLASEDGYCVVKELIPGGPAQLSKELQVNDKIIAVAQGAAEPVDVIGMNLRKVVNMIRGQKGTEIRLTTVPADAADDSVQRQIVLVRDVVQLNDSRAKATIEEVPTADGGTMPIGVIDIPSFYGPVDEGDASGADSKSVTADVEELVTKLKASGVRGIVLDLRRNGGGLLGEAVDLTGLFIPKGVVVQVRDSLGQISDKRDTNPKVAYDGPLMVLTSRYSASASEIVAGALQNYGRAIIVGDSSTHGKGTVQAVLEMKTFLPRATLAGNRAGAAKLTIQKFYLPNGSSTQQKGVIPDISLPAIEDYLPIGEADLPNSLPWDTIAPAGIRGRQLDSMLCDHLRNATRMRVNTLEEFDFLKARIAWLREREERQEISVNLEKRRAMKTDDEKFREEMKTRQNALAELNFVQKDVVLDSVAQSDNEAPTQQELLDKANGEEDADLKPFDVHMREALRVLRDAIEVAPEPRDWTQSTAMIAALTKPRPATPAVIERN
ncbi:MAG: carboxy terminal-processing peptidase [Opitutaceae bacterium]|nr:carboxy terminal-processing peptidase [Opitutaceae bacterium]